MALFRNTVLKNATTSLAPYFIVATLSSCTQYSQFNNGNPNEFPPPPPPIQQVATIPSKPQVVEPTYRYGIGSDLQLARQIWSDSKNPPHELERIDLSEEQSLAVERGLKGRLKDPYSASISAVVAGRGNDGSMVFVCGYYNARNSFGGYVGDTPFMGMLAHLTTKRWQFVPLAIEGTSSKRAVTTAWCELSSLSAN